MSTSNRHMVEKTTLAVTCQRGCHPHDVITLKSIPSQKLVAKGTSGADCHEILRSQRSSSSR